MPTTEPDDLPYPEATDTPDVPRDVQALALAVQAALLTRDSAFGNRILYGPAADVPSYLAPGQLYAGY